MTRSLAQANKAIERVRKMPQGLARTQAAEQQLHLVETEGPDEARAFASWVLVEAYVWGGEVDKSFVAFTRLLRWWETRPETFDDQDRYSLFWSFKWMISSLMEFPTVSAEQIDRTLADMEQRYRIQGEGMDAVALERFEWARARGAADAEEAFAAWLRSPRDVYSHCEACEPRVKAEWYVETGRRDEGVRLLEGVLAGKPRCATEPAFMLTTLAEAYLDLGRAADCVTTYRRAVAEMPRAESDMAEPRGRLIRLLAMAGHPDRALRSLVAEQHLLLAAESPGARLAFLLAVGAATHVIRSVDESRVVSLTSVPVGTVAELDDWVRREAEALGQAFDARNGTSRFREKIDAAWATAASGLVLELDVIRAEGARGPAEPAVASGPTEAGDPSTPQAEPTRTAAEALESAERLATAKKLVDAVPHYLQAAQLFEDAGLLVDSGYAWAEAAHAAALLGDDAGASRTFATAIGRLRAGGATPAQVVPVLVAWAACAATAGDGEIALAAAVEIGAELDREIAGEPGTETATRCGAADLLDTRARLLASLDRRAEAAVLAEAAAQAYATIGVSMDSAHAYWLAGRLHDAVEQTANSSPADLARAQECLESAVAAFGAARARDDRSRAAGDLLALLRRTGQHGRAEELAAELAAG